MDNPEQLPAVLAFCAGYGGIERGIDLAGVPHRVAAYVEVEAFAVANLVAKMEQGTLAPAPVWTDLKTFPAGLFRGSIDLITGGYPCQPFSAAGQRKGTDDPRHLWPYISEAIGIIRPRRVFFENVEGHISLGLREVLSDLEGRGYRQAWGVFSAAEVGAPHQRRRVYIMADMVDMADAGGQGLEGHTRHGDEGGQPGRVGTETNGSISAGGVRPGRGDFWRETPPPVRRVDDGHPDYVDRCRLLGNGVVPQTAARAWQVLHEELAGLRPIDGEQWLGDSNIEIHKQVYGE